MWRIALRLRPSEDDLGGFQPWPGPNGEPAADNDLQYVVEIAHVERQFTVTAIARAATPGTAWAAYYAAVREYPGLVITLRRAKQTLATTHTQPH